MATPDPLAPEESRAGGAPPGAAARPLRTAIGMLALAFFAVPLVAVALLGAGGRLPGERPGPSPSVDQGWRVLETTGAYVATRLRGRADAVTANNWISERLLGATPSYGVRRTGGLLPFERGAEPSEATGTKNGGADELHAAAFVGRHGWTFLQAELDRNCQPPLAVETAVSRWQRLVSIVRASGRPVVLMVVPEKSTIYPDYVPGDTVGWDCARAGKERLWDAVEALRDPDVVGLRQPLLERRRSGGQHLYLPINSHWNDLAGAELASRALDHVGGRVRMRLDELQPGRSEYPSDLAQFSGRARTGKALTLTVRRRGDDTVSLDEAELPGGGKVAVSTHPTHGAPVIAGRTLFLRDSFGNSPGPMLQHYAARMVAARWSDIGEDALPSLIAKADTVIIEAVERSFWGLPSNLPYDHGGSVLTPPKLRALERALAGGG
jgi:hypothetical protein